MTGRRDLLSGRVQLRVRVLILKFGFGFVTSDIGFLNSDSATWKLDERTSSSKFSDEEIPG